MTDPAARRATAWAALGRERWDLLVVGGGITGAGAAVDAAARGLRVALVEARDFGSGASGGSSRLVHGGLRYLEQGAVGLVREASRERAWLLRHAAHLVRPLRFLFPLWHESRLAPWRLRVGLWLYDRLATGGWPRHRWLDRAAARREEPALRAGTLRGAGVYWDAQLDDARATYELVRASRRLGALALSYARVEALTGRPGRWTVAVRDTRTGAVVEVHARAVLNATGAWVDELRRIADPSAPPRLRPTRGLHLVFPADRVGLRNAVAFLHPEDGRVLFALPWDGLTYVGTTDVDHPGDPATAGATPEECAYLVAALSFLVPEAGIRGADALAAWSGVRPLLAPPDARSPSATPREHEVWEDPNGLLSIAGGKLTTYRRMAAEAVDAVARQLARAGRAVGPSPTARLAFPRHPPAGEEALRQAVRATAQSLGLRDIHADHLTHRYGTAAFALLRHLAARPELAEPLVPERPDLAVEAEFALLEEDVLTLEDLFARRLHLLYETADGAASAAAAWAARLAAIWQDDAAAIVSAYRDAVARTRPLAAEF